MLALGHIETVWRLVVVPSHDVVYVTDTSGPHPDLGEVYGPYTAIGILGLILRQVGSVDVVMDISGLPDAYLSLSSHSW